MADLLLELGTEELPARFVVPALDDLERTFKEQAAALGLTHGAIRRFGTPRRLALLVSGLIDKTPDVKEQKTGPGVKAAFEADGKPKQPAIKFAESVGLPVEKLERVTTPKGEYLAATVEVKGKRAIELLPDVLNACVRKINFAKSMRWGDVPQSFGRPLHSIVALLDGEVVPALFADVKSGRTTKGHRFLSPQPIELKSPKDYEAAMEKANVVADIEKRKSVMVEKIAALAKQAGGTVIEDPELVDQVVNLIELPCPVLGRFEERHLDLPPEVLVQEMKSHQRYFSLKGPNGKLLPAFVAVSNTPVKDEKLSVAGYERVLKARLSDGRFFFDEDRKSRLEARNERLQRRQWFEGLGSVADKVGRIVSLAQFLNGKPDATIERAAKLCKADLETGMVGEFPELQGVMGREYALHDGEPKEVALAIFEHYLPRGATDSLPTQDAGAFIGIADRLDSIVGLFSVGKKPTGAKDQFGLRRACLAVINLTLAKGYRFSLSKAIAEAGRSFKNVPAADVLEFFRGRLESLWREGNRPDAVEAVLAAGFDDLVAAQKRLYALSAEVQKPGFSDLAVAFKRVANIVEKQAKDVKKGAVDASLLRDDAEKALHSAVQKVRDEVFSAAKADDYARALSRVVTLKPAVDLFFDKVLVMDKDVAVKENRVRLLMEIGDLFNTVADFSKLQG
ncbi:MAG: glycine--tRNA ligase subunit beta [Myxococcaceae bacterium]|nr:glycine--tRNA ligase subunit beta [Myxococcaceae bacterium]